MAVTPEQRRLLAALDRDIRGLTDEAQDELRPLLIAFAAALALHIREETLETEQAMAAALTQLESRAGRLYRDSFTVAARTQLASLGQLEFIALLEADAVVSGMEHAAAVRARTPVVVRNRGLDAITGALRLPYLTAYNDMIAAAASMQSMKDGMDHAGVLAGAPLKMFVRVVPRREPREHSILEGRVQPKDQPWNINGYLVQSPGSPLLPLEERIYCGHANLYL